MYLFGTTSKYPVCDRISGSGRSGHFQFRFRPNTDRINRIWLDPTKHHYLKPHFLTFLGSKWGLMGVKMWFNGTKKSKLFL